MDQWAEVLGEQRLRSVCSRCGEEFDRYFEAALDAFGQDIPEAELPNVVRKLSTRTDMHMRNWCSGAPER
jgi:hypothetical protein